MDIRLAEIVSPYLTRAARAEELCVQIFERWTTEPVALDFSAVQTISPSFANTLIMNFLHRVSVEDLRERVRFVSMSDHVRQAIERAIFRHESLGIELSAYVSS